MHKLVAFILGCVAGYALNECIEAVVGSLTTGQDSLPLPCGQKELP